MTPWSRVGLSTDEYLSLPLGARIAVCAAPYLSWGYDLSCPAVAYPSGSVPAGLVRRGAMTGCDKTNCSTLTASVLMAVYPEAPWTQREYADLQCFEDRFQIGEHYHPRGDSPIAAVESVGVGHVVRRWMTGSWHLVQGWRSEKPPSGGGHAFLAFAEAKRLEVLVASGGKRGGKGVEFTWRTERELSARYPILHLARLSDG